MLIIINLFPQLLKKNLFFADPTLQKIRYNINVVRPLRHNIEKNTKVGGVATSELYSKISSYGIGKRRNRMVVRRRLCWITLL